MSPDAPLSPMGVAALRYAAELGWAVFPVHVVRDGACSCGSTKCESPGKHPRTFRGLKDATCDPDQIAAWWGMWPESNVGLPTGEVTGLYVVDLDGPEAPGTLGLYGEVPPTPVSVTGNGRHLVFAYPTGSDLRNTAKKLGPGVDTRGEGGYIVAPPSVHPSGHQYAWDDATGATPFDLAPAPLPGQLLAALYRIKQKLPPVELMVHAVQPELVPVSASGGPDLFVVSAERRAADIPFMESVPDGQRNQTLAEYAGRLLAKGMSELETLQLVQALNRDKCRPPLDRDEVERVVASISGAERRKRAMEGDSHDRRAADVSASAGSGFVRVTRDAFTALAQRNERPVDAIPTMLSAWNRACRGDGGGEGLARGWHLTLAGSSGAGKSLCALNVAVAALLGGHSVGFLSLEMSAQQLLARLLAIHSGESTLSLEPGRLYDPVAFSRAHAGFLAMCEDAGAHLYIAERPSGEVGWITTEMRRAADEGVRLLIVDYMQCLELRGAESMEETMRKASRAVQRVAFDCEVTTIGLSQYNRSMSFNKDAPPNKHGLTGSSGIENDSDQVLLLDHSTQRRNGHLMDTNLIVDKNRHGPQPTIPVQWDYSTLRITERVVSFGEQADDAVERDGIPVGSPVERQLRRYRENGSTGQRGAA